MMTYVAQYQSDDYLHEIAAYFGSQQAPYPPPMPTKAAPEVLARGHQLVTQGDKTLDIPACTSLLRQKDCWEWRRRCRDSWACPRTI